MACFIYKWGNPGFVTDIGRIGLSYLARKINRAKWASVAYLQPSEIKADAITGCLRTSSDSLSLWLCSLETESIDNVILALASGMEEYDNLHIVLVEESELHQQNLTIVNNPGVTPVSDLRSFHRDIINLDMNRLCAFASLVKGNIDNPLTYRQFTKAQVSTILCNAIRQNRLRLDELRGKVHARVSRDLSLSN